MKIINGMLILFFLCTIGVTSCAEKAEQNNNGSVYLAVEDVQVSSFDTTPDWAPPPEPKAVTDGSLLTRWSSAYKENQWVTLDFGRPKQISRAVIFWEAAYAADYDILSSLDGKNWQVLLSLKDQDGGVDKLNFSPVRARYLRLEGKRRFNKDWGISLWELLCFGPGSENPQDRPLSLVYAQLAKELGESEAQGAAESLEEPRPSPGKVGLNEMQKGVVYTSWSKTELGEKVSDDTLKYLRNIGVRHLGIMVVWYQESVQEDIISPDAKDTPDDSALVHAINQAHSLGMKVMLKPHVDVRSGEWRGEIIPSQNWFESYRDYLLYYARLAERYNVELFSIGTELSNTTMPRWQGQWDETIRAVRAVYSGMLTYSANWDEYDTVDFWAQLDFVGIDAYFPLTGKKDPTEAELVAAWQENAQAIDSWRRKKRVGTPVIFTEVGYCSADGTNIQPWTVYTDVPGGVQDPEEQAQSLDAMMQVCSRYRWFKGLYWWNYFPQERWSPLGYIIREKKAEEVFSAWLKKL